MNKENKVEKENTINSVPVCDVLENNRGVRVLLDMPGVSADQLQVDVKDRILKVTGRTAEPWHNRQIFYHRDFELSEEIDCTGISAKIKNGVLELTLPKLASARVHKIPVTTE
ncbi:MAG: Hsp20/alpha crystallin family protein [Lentisphaeria bacterium]|nr:Hsp20/alpha crystallin family protein [Lentisphaeria bacterium]